MKKSEKNGGEDENFNLLFDYLQYLFCTFFFFLLISFGLEKP